LVNFKGKTMTQGAPNKIKKFIFTMTSYVDGP
jgi:hypothetical protein